VHHAEAPHTWLLARAIEVKTKYFSRTRFVFINIATEPQSFIARITVYISEGAFILLARARSKTNESLASMCMRIWHET
jgi:hypothetical protein